MHEHLVIPGYCYLLLNLVIFHLAVTEFGLERQLYSTVEGSEGVEICVEVLQGNVTQRTLIGIRNNIGSAPSKY